MLKAILIASALTIAFLAYVLSPLVLDEQARADFMCGIEKGADPTLSEDEVIEYCTSKQ